MLLVLALVSSAFALIYLGLFISYIKGWKKIPEVITPKDYDGKVPISIIITARNEEKNIRAVLQCILNQDYPKDLYDVIVVNDNSEDNTLALIEEFQQLAKGEGLSISIINLQDYIRVGFNESYKKKGITLAVEQAKNEWIISTDADCIMCQHWLRSYSFCIEENNPNFISAPVCLQENRSYLQVFQAFDFVGLNAIGAASIQNKRPNMCNGANMAYKKTVFNQIKGYEGVSHIASGDDEYLMHKFWMYDNESIVFNKNEEAIVTTFPESSFLGFVAQRRRWVSKSRKYQVKRIGSELLMAYLFSVWFTIIFIGSFVSLDFFWYFLIMATPKFLIELYFYRLVLPFYSKKYYLYYFIESSILHSIYVTLIGILGNFGTYNWKGRSIQ